VGDPFIAKIRGSQVESDSTSQTPEPQTRTGKDPQPRPRVRGVTEEKSLSENDNILPEPKHDTRKEIAKAAGVSTGQVCTT
jgi:hypothetical protein